MTFSAGFGLLITSPPAYNPRKHSEMHGTCFVGSMHEYLEAISSILVRIAKSVNDRRLCLIKTDVWSRGKLIPISYELARACVDKGLMLRAHFVAKRTASFTPYGPTISNIFVFGDSLFRPKCSSILDVTPRRRKAGIPSSFTPELFTALARLLSSPGDVLIDPFAGVGSVMHAGLASGRGSVGIEISAGQIRRAARLLHGLRSFRTRDGHLGLEQEQA